MEWAEIVAAFLLCHVAGDFLLQTDHQAMNKRGGLFGPRVSRGALWTHIATYTLAFAPAIAWIASERDAGVAALVVAAIAIPHAIVDDGATTRWWTVHVKHAPNPVDWLMVAIDQSMHIVMLGGLALLLAT